MACRRTGAADAPFRSAAARRASAMGDGCVTRAGITDRVALAAQAAADKMARARAHHDGAVGTCEPAAKPTA